MCLDVPYMQKFPTSFEGLSSGLIISSAALLWVLALAWSLLTDLSLNHVPLHGVVAFFENGSQEISYTEKCCKRTDLWGNTCSHEHLSWLCVYTDHQTEQYDKYCSFIVSSNRRMPSAWSLLGYSLQGVISIIKEIISCHSEIIISYSETYILTFNTHVPASLL